MNKRLTPNEKLFVDTFIELTCDGKDISCDDNIDYRYALCQRFVTENSMRWNCYINNKMDTLDEETFDNWIDNLSIENNFDDFKSHWLPTKKMSIDISNYLYWSYKICSILKKCYKEIEQTLPNDDGIIYGYKFNRTLKQIDFKTIQVKDNKFTTQNYKVVKKIIYNYKTILDNMFDDFEKAQPNITVSTKGNIKDFFIKINSYRYKSHQLPIDIASAKLSKRLKNKSIQIISIDEYNSRKAYYDKKIAKLNADKKIIEDDYKTNSSIVDNDIYIYHSETERFEIYQRLLNTFKATVEDVHRSQRQKEEHIDKQGIVDLYCFSITPYTFLRRKGANITMDEFDVLRNTIFTSIVDEEMFNKDDKYIL